MLQAFVITLREGLEAFLIVAISLAYLKKTGRSKLVSAVHWGIGLSILVSIGAALLFQQASNQALWEGVLALVAAVLVASLIVHMWRHARKMKREIESHLSTRIDEQSAQMEARIIRYIEHYAVIPSLRRAARRIFPFGRRPRGAQPAE